MSDSIKIITRTISQKPRSKNHATAGGTIIGGSITGITGNTSDGVDIIKVDDTRALTDKNVLSALRALAEIQALLIKSGSKIEASEDKAFSSNRTINEIINRAISKVKDDTAEGLINFLKGLTSEEKVTLLKGFEAGVFREGLSGAAINEQGDGELKSLIVRLKAVMAELEVKGQAKTGSLKTETVNAKSADISEKATTLNLLVKALAEIHNLTVDDTARMLCGIIRESLSSPDFAPGFAGNGFRIYKDAVTGDWNAEVDNLVVRKLFNVFEVRVQRIVHQGGMVIRSAAGGKITKVTDAGSYWRCEHDGFDDFAVGDQVLCQAFKFIGQGGKIKRYWRLATEAGKGYVCLSKSDCEAGSATPEVGDEIVVLGNRTNRSRQSAQIDCVIGADAPYRDTYDGINGYSLAGKLITREGNLSGIVDADFGSLNGYGLYTKNLYAKGRFRLTNGKTVERYVEEVADSAKGEAVRAAAEDAQQRVDGLRIGGRNLLVNSANLGLMGSDSRDKLARHENGLFEVKGDAKWGGNVWSILFERNLYNVNLSRGGKTYTASVDVLCEGVLTGELKWAFNFNTGERGEIVVVTKETSVEKKGYWQRVSATITIPEGDYTGTQKFVVYLLFRDAPGLIVRYKNLQIEEGNKASAWSPAPEDLQAAFVKEISNIRTSLDVLEGRIVAKVERTDFNALGQRVGTVETNIRQQADSVRAQAERYDALNGRLQSAEAKITPDAIRLTVKSQTDTLIAEALPTTKKSVDLKALDENKYYPVTMKLKANTRMAISVKTLLSSSYGKPGWTAHSQGSFAETVWETAAGGWGAWLPGRVIKQSSQGYVKAGIVTMGSIGQNTMNNEEYIYVRGGKVYDIEVTGMKDVVITLHKTDYLWEYSPGSQSRYLLPVRDSVTAPAVTYTTKKEFQSSIEQLGNRINLKVSQADFNDLGQRVRTAESSITQLPQTIDARITSGVNEGGIIKTKVESWFRMEGNKMFLGAKSIDMSGAVVFRSLATKSETKAAADNALAGAKSYTDILRNSLGDLAKKNSVEQAMREETLIVGGYIKTSLIDTDALRAKVITAGSITAEHINVKSLQAAIITAEALKAITVEAKVLKAGPNPEAPQGYNALIDENGNGHLSGGALTFDNGEMTFKGRLSGVSGSFKRLDVLDSNDLVVGSLSFSSDSRLTFEGVDMQHQGIKNGRSLRFLASDIWCRGGFGAAGRNVMVITGSTAVVYVDGADSYGVSIRLNQRIATNGRTYYEVGCNSPGYSDLQTNKTSGFPVDMIVFNHTGIEAYWYDLKMRTSQRVLVVNANDYHNNVIIYVNGREYILNNGSMTEIIEVGKWKQPQVPSHLLGAGLMVGMIGFDNNWINNG